MKSNTLKVLLTILSFLVFFAAFGQTKKLIVNDNIILPRDTAEAKELIAALDNFLVAAQRPNEQNTLVLPSQKLETFILLDELNGIEKSGRFKDDFFYKPYLTNLVPIENNAYIAKVAHIGVNEKTPILCGDFEFIAHKTGSTFLFSSPLVRNTANWNVKKGANNVFVFQKTIIEKKVSEFNTLADSFDKKLNSKNTVSKFYLCSNFVEAQRLIGVNYKLEYNGYPLNTFSSSLDNTKLIVMGNNSANFDSFDPHDLWHDRLSLVIARSKTNKPVDEGCAYLYGGSWGMAWQEIFSEFKKQIASNKNTDWAAIKESPVYFTTQGYNNSADNIVNALLVKKIEKEKGFAGVWQLLTCGPQEKGNGNYYKALEKLTGITKLNYNQEVEKLIEAEK
jgi:hypothetical protein